MYVCIRVCVIGLVTWRGNSQSFVVVLLLVVVGGGFAASRVCSVWMVIQAFGEDCRCR